MPYFKTWAENILLPNAGIGTGSRKIIYARSTGNDATGTGTLVNPYRTLQRCLKDIPIYILYSDSYIIDITGIGLEDIPGGLQLPHFVNVGDYIYNFAPDAPGFEIEAPLTIRALPTPASTIDTLLAGDIISQVLDPDTGLLTINTNKAYALDALRRTNIYGSGFFEIGAIESNTAGPNTSITVCSTTPLTTPIIICTPNAEIRNNTPFDFQNSGINIRGLSCTTVFQGIKISNITDFISGLLLTGSKDISFISCHLPNAMNHSGECIGDPVYWGVVFGNGLMSNNYVYLNGGIPLFYNCFMDTINWRYNGGGHHFPLHIEGTICNGCTSIGKSSPIELTKCHIKNSAGHGIAIESGTVDTNSITYTKIDNSLLDGIRCNLINGVLGLNNIRGVGNGGIGLNIQSDGARCLVADNNTDITGAGGDLKVGGLPVRTWVNFRTIAPIKIEADIGAINNTQTQATMRQP